MTRYVEALERFREELDSLNVYPVPDGDTGTNLLQTVQAVVRALDRSAESGGEEASVARTIARASLMGARGNSGVILSQTLRGLCEGIPAGGADGNDVASALRSAATASRRAVDEPREGTVLTVLDDAAEAATASAARGGDAGDVLAGALEAARESLARTVNEVPELRAAGVVDAGGKGAVLLLDALHAQVSGGEPTEQRGSLGPVGVHGTTSTPPALEFAWEVQALVEAPAAAVTGLRSSLVELGGSLAVVGGDGLFNVHVHTDRPDDAVARIREASAPLELSVVSLANRVAACGMGGARAVQAGLPLCAMVAVAAGAGLAAAFRSLGATVVAGDPGTPPSLAEIRAAMSPAPGRSVLVLVPDDAALLSVVRDACASAARPSTVVAVDSAPSGLSAATAFHPEASLEENERVMRAAAVRCRAEPSASRDPRDLLAVAERLCGLVPAAELLTLVAGEGITSDDAAAAAGVLRAGLPDLEVQVVLGDQPGVAYVLGVE